MNKGKRDFFNSPAVPKYSITNDWDNNGTVTLVSQYAYTHDDLARRDVATLTGAAFTAALGEDYGYNARNELTTTDYQIGGLDADAKDRGYGYDPIGNRETSTLGDPAARTWTYQTNEVNQYAFTIVQNPAMSQGLRYDDDGNLTKYFVVADMNCDGVANFDDIDPFVTAVVSQSDYELQYPNCDWLNGDLNGDGIVNFDDVDLISTVLVNGGGGLTADFEWDAENRLTAFIPAVRNQDVQKVEYEYDYLGRRVCRRAYDWVGPGYDDWSASPEVTKYIWTGWLLLAELDASYSYVRKYTWGLDLGGLNGGQTSDLAALQQAGTIGGLLAVSKAQQGGGYASGGVDAGEYICLYDANGNVGQLIDWGENAGGTTGFAWDTNPATLARVAARYEYSPYGQLIGPDTNSDGEFDETDDAGHYANANAWRFSTKQWDDVTGLGYWGYRYYSAALGRWVSRDPSNEGKCPNLYTAFSNQPTDRIDPDGRDDEPVTQPTTVPAFDEGESSGKGYLAWNETPESIWQRMAEGRLNACPTSLKLPAAVEEMLARAMAATAASGLKDEAGGILSCEGTAHRVWGLSGASRSSTALQTAVWTSYDFGYKKNRSGILKYGSLHTHPHDYDTPFTPGDLRLLGSQSRRLVDGQWVDVPGWQIELMRNCKCTRAVIALSGFNSRKVEWPYFPTVFDNNRQEKYDNYDRQLAERSGKYAYCFYQSCARNQSTLELMGGSDE